MTCTELTATASDLPCTSRSTSLSALVARWWKAYWDRRAQKATVAILHSLDERTLHDIGVSPSEIESLVYGCTSDRRRRYHERWWR